MKTLNLKLRKKYLSVVCQIAKYFGRYRHAFILVISAVSLFLCISAQIPQQMSYQAVIRNSSGQLLINKPVGIRISILKTTNTGNVVYSETQTPTTNANGLISIQIGGGTGFETIDWGADKYYLKTEVDPAGGTAYSITSTNQLLSVPYALYSASTANPMVYPGAGIPLSTGTAWGTSITDNSANWNTAFTNRISSLTTTGSSGAATLNSNTLNIPNYTLAGLGGVGLSALSAVSPLSYNSGTGAFSIPAAGSSQNGYLSSTDWTTFTGKQNALSNPVTSSSASATANQLAVFNGTGVQVTPTTALPTAAMPALTGDVTNTAGSLATTLSKIKGTSLSITYLTTGDILKYNGTNWVNTAVALPASTAGAYTLYGNNTVSTAAPTYFIPFLASSLFANQGTATTVLHGNASGAPSWGSVNLTADVSGTLPVGSGGTGITTAPTPGAVVYGATATTMGYTAAGTTGQVLTSGGSGAPTWTDQSSLTNIYTANGTLGANRTVSQNTNTLTFTNSISTGTGFGITGTGVYTGGGLVGITANSATTGTVAAISATGLTTGIGLSLSTTALTSGTGLIINGPTTGSTFTGNLLNLNTGSTGASSNGFARFNFSGAHTGNGFQIDDATATGTAMDINTNSLTTGTALDITTTNASLASTNGFFRVYNNGAASGTSPFVRLQPNSTAGSGLTITNDGNMGIGTSSAPASKLEVNGAATNSSATSVSTATVDFSLSNIATTSFIGTAFTLNGMKSGGAYTLILTGTTNTGTSTFTATGFTIKYMGTVSMTTSKTHIYSFIVAGTVVYITMATEN